MQDWIDITWAVFGVCGFCFLLRAHSGRQFLAGLVFIGIACAMWRSGIVLP